MLSWLWDDFRVIKRLGLLLTLFHLGDFVIALTMTRKAWYEKAVVILTETNTREKVSLQV
jgi:hypothetical protein